MEFLKSEKENLDEIMEIINLGKEYFKSKGIPQWQDGYPNIDVILDDIKKGHSYILKKDEEIIATVAICLDGESDYDKIYEGSWLSTDKFVVIHRIAITNKLKGQGISAHILKCAEDICKENNINSIKVDTHRNNLSMRRFLEKNDYKYCGLIYLEDGAERVAYEKLI